ncbi:hypothetical protein GWK47_044524 [Chionoecetes opilio]|uniref:Uncharacterized protein n=1 Tax=Chionoecetes opilio TaxID=41210 RepID=A0A8J4Y932_CHIOP|nr:hypothetical protein GWK47_044524 [Chionoecetes opilio]
MKGCIFRDSLEDMSDIAHSKAMEAKIPEEEKAFLEAQGRTGRAARWLALDEKLKQRLGRSDSSTTSSSSKEETEDDDFKAPTPLNVHAVDLLRGISSPKGADPCLGARQSVHPCCDIPLRRCCNGASATTSNISLCPVRRSTGQSQEPREIAFSLL